MKKKVLVKTGGTGTLKAKYLIQISQKRTVIQYEDVNVFQMADTYGFYIPTCTVNVQ
jgi:hypothetical protein